MILQILTIPFFIFLDCQTTATPHGLQWFLVLSSLYPHYSLMFLANYSIVYNIPVTEAPDLYEKMIILSIFFLFMMFNVLLILLT